MVVYVLSNGTHWLLYGTKVSIVENCYYQELYQVVLPTKSRAQLFFTFEKFWWQYFQLVHTFPHLDLVQLRWRGGEAILLYPHVIQFMPFLKRLKDYLNWFMWKCKTFEKRERTRTFHPSLTFGSKWQKRTCLIITPSYGKSRLFFVAFRHFFCFQFEFTSTS